MSPATAARCGATAGTQGIHPADAASLRGVVRRRGGQGGRVTPGILPYALRASLRLFKIAPGDYVSLHAGVAARADERKKLERLCRYISRPAVSEKRLSLTPNGNIRYRLKTPYRDGTTHVIFEPLDFIARLAALVPKPRLNLIRFHGVFAPNSRYRGRVTKAKRGRGGRPASTGDPEAPTLAERRAAMTWSQRLKRVFGIDIETCPACGGAVRIIACIEDPVVIEKVLTHLNAKGAAPEATRRPPCRAPPQTRLFHLNRPPNEHHPGLRHPAARQGSGRSDGQNE